MGAFYCAVCRQTTFGGKGHIFGKSHQSRLRVVLLKFLEKVKEARRTLKKPQVEKFDCTRHKQKFWCYCCGLEVDRNVTDGNIAVLYGSLLEHMATPEHRKNTHKFWWENKADPKLRDKVIVTEEETERFKAELANVLETFVEKEDEFIKQEADCIRFQEKHRQEVLQSLLERDAEAELFNGPNGTDMSAEDPVSSQFKYQGSDQQPGSSFVESVVGVRRAATAQGLTFIGYQDSSNGGNVHTEEQAKLKKLPPNRVGANFDHTSQTDANWLPSFGRVWNSGRRWQSSRQLRSGRHTDTGRSTRSNWPSSSISRSLLGNFEESILKGRFSPSGQIEGFTAEIGASGSYCPQHVTLPVQVTYYDISEQSAPSPFLGVMSLEPLGKKGYSVPKAGTIQVTLFNPNKTVVKMFLATYNFDDMPVNHMTFLRHRIFLVPVEEEEAEGKGEGPPGGGALDRKKTLCYLMHLRFQSSKSGKIYLHNDIRLLFSRKSIEVDSGISYELKSFTEVPRNPKYSPRV
ncbi:hypothetical protein F2P81_014247 [Scophthalmus maximus]|uniref:Atos homolog protein B n=1 Tax=Scophthalmus maximus TaxID=52904 RepID=A0A6A4ST26_SCOMX|nr:hypothetical protein F2P81_014247 [Scophthalmus maximus]